MIIISALRIVLLLLSLPILIDASPQRTTFEDGEKTDKKLEQDQEQGPEKLQVDKADLVAKRGKLIG